MRGAMHEQMFKEQVRVGTVQGTCSGAQVSVMRHVRGACKREGQCEGGCGAQLSAAELRLCCLRGLFCPSYHLIHFLLSLDLALPRSSFVVPAFPRRSSASMHTIQYRTRGHRAVKQRWSAISPCRAFERCRYCVRPGDANERGSYYSSS